MKYILIVFLSTIFFISCEGDKLLTPKPRMYPRVVYPEKSYTDFEFEACKFKFKMPSYAEVKTGIDFFGEESKDPCWFDLNIESLKSSIHFSYNKIGGENTLDKLVTDAFKLADKHNVKAEYKDESIVENRNGVKGLLFEIEGPVASPVNFFLTDTTEHFVRASLYFNSKVNPDSIAPVLEFVKKDIDKIIATFEWKD